MVSCTSSLFPVSTVVGMWSLIVVRHYHGVMFCKMGGVVHAK